MSKRKHALLMISVSRIVTRGEIEEWLRVMGRRTPEMAAKAVELLDHFSVPMAKEWDKLIRFGEKQ